MNRQTKTLTWDSRSTWRLTSTETIFGSAVQPTIVTTVLESATMLMPAIYVTAKKGEFPITSDQTASFPSTSDHSPTNSSTDRSSAGSGLSTGAKAGTGVGVAAAVILACIGALLFWRRKHNNSSDIVDTGPPEWTKAELTAEKTPRSELAVGHREMAHELPYEEPPRELP